MSCERALGSIGISVDGWMEHLPHMEVLREMNEAIEALPQDDAHKDVLLKTMRATHMLAAHTFDLTRRMGYLFWATKEFGLHADPSLARRVKRINEQASTLAKERKYEQLCELLGQEVHDECPFIQPLYNQTLDILADEKWQTSPERWPPARDGA